MHVTLLPAAELTDEHVATWSRLQRAEAAFDSPYFRPEFTQAVARVRSGVEIALLEAEGRTVGFFPFQRGRGDVGVPVGGTMSNFHGVILERGQTFDADALVRGCRLVAWHFDHLPVAQALFQPYHWSVAGSPYLDLSGGWSRYEARQLREHKVSFKRTMRKLRQVTEEVGDLRFEYHSADPQVFATMVDWKRKQYRATGVADVLALPWTVDLLRQVLREQTDAFSGILSALYIDDTLAAILLSMRSYDVLHGWFSVYRPDFSAFSPGLILWIELAKAAQRHGLRRIDLGKGPETYKTHLMSGTTAVAEGSVDTRSVVRFFRHGWHRTYHWLRNSPLKGPLQVPGRFVRCLLETKKLRR